MVMWPSSPGRRVLERAGVGPIQILSENIMEPTVNTSGEPSEGAGKDTRTHELSDTVQSRRDVAEKEKHSRSENELETSQDKNPLPAGSTRPPASR
jgi:hypothetical protein